MFPIAIAAIKNDDDRTFMEQLYIKHRKIMYKTAYSMLRNDQDIEDIINTACISIIGKIDRLRGFDSCTLQAYLVSTIKNTAINFIKKRDRIRDHTASDPDSAFATAVSNDPEVDRDLLRRLDLENLKQALRNLPEQEMTLLQMKYVLDLPDEQIAKEFGIKRASVRSYLSKARRHAREILKESKK